MVDTDMTGPLSPRSESESPVRKSPVRKKVEGKVKGRQRSPVRSASPREESSSRSPIAKQRSRSRSRSPRRHKSPKSTKEKRRKSLSPRKTYGGERSYSPHRGHRSLDYRDRHDDRRGYDRGGYDRGGYQGRGNRDRGFHDRHAYSRQYDSYGARFNSRSVRSSGPFKRQRSPPASGPHLFIAGLDFDVTDKELRNKAAAYGDVVSARVVRNRFTEDSKGFGFVEMRTEDQATKVIKALDHELWNGRTLQVERARNTTPI